MLDYGSMFQSSTAAQEVSLGGWDSPTPGIVGYTAIHTHTRTDLAKVPPVQQNVTFSY